MIKLYKDLKLEYLVFSGHLSSFEINQLDM